MNHFYVISSEEKMSKFQKYVLRMFKFNIEDDITNLDLEFWGDDF